MHIKMCCMPANTKNISKYVLTKPVSFLEELKMHLNLWSKNFPRQRRQKMYLSCVDLTRPWQWEPKVHLNLCWTNPSHASGDTKCISTCVDQASKETKCSSTFVDQTFPMCDRYSMTINNYFYATTPPQYYPHNWQYYTYYNRLV